MATLGPETQDTEIVNNAPPPPPPMAPKMPALKKKSDNLNEETAATIDKLKQMVSALNARISTGDVSAEAEYDQLKKMHADELATFTKDIVSVLEAQVKALEEDNQTQTALLLQETNLLQSKQKNLSKQLETLNLQKTKFSQLQSVIETSIQEIQNELTLVTLRQEKELPRLQANQQQTSQALKSLQSKLIEVRKQREQLVAISQAIPVRVKTKQVAVQSADIDFQSWIESQLLGGLYLSFLKKFLNKDLDEDVIARCNTLTDPSARRMLPVLSLPTILAIASGYIARSNDKRYNDAMPLKDSHIDDSKLFLLEALLAEFYSANPAFAKVHAQEFGANPGESAFIKALSDSLHKAVNGAQPKETPKALPVVAAPKPQLPAFTLKKADVPAHPLDAPKTQLPAFVLKKTLAPAKRTLPATPVQAVASSCKNEATLANEGRATLLSSK